MFRRIRRWWHRRKIKNAIHMLKTLDVAMIKAELTRAERRRVWREMVKDRKEVVNALQDIYDGGN